MFNLPLRRGISYLSFKIFWGNFFCFCFVVLINIFHTPIVQYFQSFLYKEGKYLSHSLLFLLIHMVLIEFKLYEKKYSCVIKSQSKDFLGKIQQKVMMRSNEKAKATPFFSNEKRIRIKQIHVILPISWHKTMLKSMPFFWQSYQKTQLKHIRI